MTEISDANDKIINETFELNKVTGIQWSARFIVALTVTTDETIKKMLEGKIEKNPLHLSILRNANNRVRELLDRLDREINELEVKN